jgi:hypothetical protein
MFYTLPDLSEFSSCSLLNGLSIAASKSPNANPFN